MSITNTLRLTSLLEEETAMCHICPLTEIDILISNNCPENEQILAEYKSFGVEVIIV